MALIYALLAGLAVSAVSLIGLVTFFTGKDLHARVSHMLLALAAGAMLGNAVLHLVPHAITLEQEWSRGAAHVHVHGGATAHGAGHDHDVLPPKADHEDADEHEHDAVKPLLGPEGHGHNHTGLLTAFLIMAGFISFYGVDVIIRSRIAKYGEKPEGYLAAFGDGIENFLDGIVIGTAFMLGVPAGIAVTVSIFIHEIPLELGDYAVMRHAGFSMRKAIVTNMLSALLSLVGIVVAFAISSMVASFVLIGTGVAAGALLYIATCILIPHVRKSSEESGGLQYFLVSLFGVALMAAILLFE